MSKINTIPMTPAQVLSILPEAYELKQPIYLHGNPGIGKTTVFKDFAKEHGIGITVKILSHMADGSDLIGLQFIDQQDKRTINYPPDFLPLQGKTDGPGIFFLDELAAAEPRLQATAYQLIHEGRVGEHILDPRWWRVGAGNLPENGAVAYNLSTALADRFLHIIMMAEPKSFIAWAQKNNIHPAVITMIEVYPDQLEGNEQQVKSGNLICPTPRSWEAVSGILYKTQDPYKRDVLIAGRVGNEAAGQFKHVLEEIASLRPIEEYVRAAAKIKNFKAGDSGFDALLRLLPDTMPSLYGLAYGVQAWVNDLEGLCLATDIFEVVASVEDDLMRAELQTFCMELLIQKSSQMGCILEFGTSAAYGRYQKKAREITDITMGKK